MFSKDLREFEEMTRPSPFRILKVAGQRMRTLRFQDRLCRLAGKAGIVKEFSYEDTITNPVQIDASYVKSYVNTYQVLATVYFSVEEIHEIRQHFFYIGDRIKDMREKGSVRVVGDEVNEDERTVRVTGNLREIKVRLGNGGYQDIDKCAAKTAIILNEVPTGNCSPDCTLPRKTARFDFSPLKNLHMERVIPCAIGSVDEEELKQVFRVMRDEMEQSLREFSINDCIVVEKGVLEA